MCARQWERGDNTGDGRNNHLSRVTQEAYNRFCDELWTSPPLRKGDSQTEPIKECERTQKKIENECFTTYGIEEEAKKGNPFFQMWKAVLDQIGYKCLELREQLKRDITATFKKGVAMLSGEHTVLGSHSVGYNPSESSESSFSDFRPKAFDRAPSEAWAQHNLPESIGPANTGNDTPLNESYVEGTHQAITQEMLEQARQRKQPSGEKGGDNASLAVPGESTPEKRPANEGLKQVAQARPATDLSLCEQPHAPADLQRQDPEPPDATHNALLSARPSSELAYKNNEAVAKKHGESENPEREINRLSDTEPWLIAQVHELKNNIGDGNQEIDVLPVKKLDRYPNSASDWKTELDRFEDWVRDTYNLDHMPTHEDYGRIINDSSVPRGVALKTAIWFAYGMNPRGGPIGEFAQKYCKRMLAQAVCHKLRPDDASGIKADLISQGFPNDCPFIATMIHMADSPEGREELYKMVTVNKRQPGQHQDTYTVVFPGDPKHGVVVDGLTEGEKMLACSSGTGDIYLAVIEKALGQFCNERRSKLLSPMAVMSEAVTYGMFEPELKPIGGMSYLDMISLLSGYEFEQTSTFRGAEQCKKAALKGLDEHAPVIVGVKTRPERGHPKARILREHPNHAYTMRSANSEGCLLRNPIDEKKKDVPREFWLTWEELASGTSCVIVGTKRIDKNEDSSP